MDLEYNSDGAFLTVTIKSMSESASLSISMLRSCSGRDVILCRHH